MKTVVYSYIQVEGLHQWSNCPIEEVEYLRDLHRHVFHIKAYKEVFHDDRDVEFIFLQHEIKQYLSNSYWSFKHRCLNFGNMSCEMIAKELIEHFGLCQCEVSEDNENGAIVYA